MLSAGSDSRGDGKQVILDISVERPAALRCATPSHPCSYNCILGPAIVAAARFKVYALWQLNWRICQITCQRLHDELQERQIG
jgi:hypothetical protein